MNHRLHAAAVSSALLSLLSLLPVAGQAWAPPAHWSAVGAVDAWEALDARFYRQASDPMFLNRSQDSVDQQEAYARTLVHDAPLPAITLETWLTLSGPERQERSRLAGRHLDFVARFRQRVESQAQYARQGEPSGWGLQIADVTVVGDCLQRLGTATGLDPSNPYAWHLYGWFADCVGDVDRAGRAFECAEQALALVPEGELVDVRRGVTLARAWSARERGDTRVASGLVEQADALGADPFQVTLLRGLLAARRGDHPAALAESQKLRHVEIRRFPMNFRTTGTAPEVNNVDVWKAVPSDFAQRWIEALSFIETGQMEMAAKAFGRYGLDHLYPQAHRFWDDAGMIYELTGRPDAALQAWEQARITTPFAPYIPWKSREHDLGTLTGRPGEQPVYLAFDSFPVAGNRLVFVVSLLEEMAREPRDAERQVLAAKAVAELDLCVMRGTYPAQASWLRGAVRELQAATGGR
jgi:tetratricopeptide (TPR) repeat protein